MATFDNAVRGKMAAYRAALDPRLGAVYRQRRLFEESVTRIGDTISSYLVPVAAFEPIVYETCTA